MRRALTITAWTLALGGTSLALAAGYMLGLTIAAKADGR